MEEVLELLEALFGPQWRNLGREAVLILLEEFSSQGLPWDTLEGDLGLN